MFLDYRCQHERTKERDRADEKAGVSIFPHRQGRKWCCSTSPRRYTDVAVLPGCDVISLYQGLMPYTAPTKSQHAKHTTFYSYMARSLFDHILLNRAYTVSESLLSLVVRICCRLGRANELCRALDADCRVV